MASEYAEFASGAAELARARALRKRGARLRSYGVVGVTYGLSAYGSPIGNVTGVQQPAPPANGGTTPTEAMSTDQFGGVAGDAGGSGTVGQ